MAKKIKIEDYEKEVSNKIKKKDKLKMCSLIVNGILGICLIISIVMYVSLYSKSVESDDIKKEWTTAPLENDCTYDLVSILKGQSIDYVREKLKFMNDNIVFKIDGFGNYYYSYDCMMEKVNGNFTYWAYNKDAAISEGLKAGGC